MSADNWTTCPRCTRKGRETEDSQRAAVMALYGSIPVDEFDEKRDAIVPFEAATTFREDYEFYGAETGSVEWCYSGSCTECGLSVKFDGSRQFFPLEASA